MENKKGVLITIVVLLCIFTPLTVIGILKTENISPLEENPEHNTYFDGHVWFYDQEGNFLSKYECQTEICEYSTTTIDDDTYGINYYKDGTINKVDLISDMYTFLTDGSVIYLYSASTGTTLQTYKRVKTYNTKLENNSYIIENSNGVWGVLSIGGVLSPVLPFEYSFIGLKNELNEDGTLSTDKFIVMKDNKWYLVDNNNSALTGYIDYPIVDYTDGYVISKVQNKVRIYSYNNYEYLSTYDIKDYVIEDKYIGVITNNFLLIYDNLGTSYIKSVVLTNSNSDVKLERKDNKINIFINNELRDSIEIS